MMDLPTYEIDLPKKVDLKKFEENVSGESEKLWLICTEDQGDFKRFRGVIFPKWVRIFLDIGVDYCYVTTPGKQALTALEVAKEMRELLGGTKIYHNGKEVTK